MKTMKPHLSQSQIELYHKCPEAYRRRYMEGEKIPPGMAMLVGTGVHIGAETNFKQKIASHEDMPADDIIDAAVAGFETRCFADGYTLSPDEQSAGARKTLGTAKDIVVDLASLHADEQAPEYQPTAVEQPTRIVLPNATHDLVSITDVRDDRGRVTDFKTAGRKPGADDAAVSLQLTINAAAYQVDHGKACTSVRLDVLTKTKTPKRHVVESTRDNEDFEALASRIDVVSKAITAGIFPPASPGSWQCSAKWCGYWRTCRFVNQTRS